ncbi:unnamed protein product [Rhizophagus irregularis]|nr:unnamed protein product [Rhizophagus irregularis]
MRNLNKLYHFFFIILTYSQHFQLLLSQEVNKIWDKSLMTSSQQSNYASSFTKNVLMNMEIYAYPELQSQLQMKVAQIESKLAQIDAFSITALITLKADTTLFTPKGKGTKRVSYVEVVK